MENVICTCGSNNTRTIIDCNDYSIIKCKICKVIFSYPFADFKEIKEIYRNYDYVDYYNDWGKTDRANLENVVQMLAKYKKKGDLLDIGSGIGNFIKALKKITSFNITALELNLQGLEELKKFNVNIIDSTWDEVSLKEASYDVITMIHSLEHMPDALSTLKKAYSFIKKDGYIVIQLPALRNPNTLMSLIKKGKKGLQKWCNPKGHIYLFTPQSIKYLVELSGFSVVWIKTGRYRFRYEYIQDRLIPPFKIIWLGFLNVVDIFADFLGIGGITLIGKKLTV